jgi:7,8-dihydropterin-6-yl-methyl-4-(beta-D-ribofuranosyl)aminobenzene 5'-phosphate synthase
MKPTQPSDGGSMTRRVPLPWWPVLALFSPVLLPVLFVANRKFKENIETSEERNRVRLDEVRPLELPELEFLEITVLVEEKTREGFLGAPGPSYWLKTDRGSMLFDVAYGPEYPALAQNASRLGFSLDQVDAMAISHLHPDHMGGLRAQMRNSVVVPKEMGDPEGQPCYLPGEAAASGFEAEVVDEPRLLAAGIATTGPLARSLFLQGLCEEQALVARIRGKGLVVISGCGHPTLERIVGMVRKMSTDPIHAIVGGFHMPVTDSPLRILGLKVQMFIGTGKPFWQRITEDDLMQTIAEFNKAEPAKVLFSAHDSCDYAAGRLREELSSAFEVLEAGATYRL